MLPISPNAEPASDSDSGAAAGRRVGHIQLAGVLLRYATFLALLLLSTVTREAETHALRFSIVWLPSGVAIAGLWLLGRRAWWVVTLATALMRIGFDYSPGIVLASALGSTAEAVLGALLLERLGVQHSFARLRDVLALFVTACLAPVASILISWIGRSLAGPPITFYSGWASWWRMNELGVLIVVPLASTWYVARQRKWRARALLEGGALAAAVLAGIGSILWLVEPQPFGIVLLYLVLPITLYSAVRFGPLGAATGAALAALAVAVGTSLGLGPFVSVALEDRHVTLQVFELSLVAVPLVLGALIAEREAALASRLKSEAARNAFQRFVSDVTYRTRADGTILDVYVPPGLEHDGEHARRVGTSLAALLPAPAAAKLTALLRATLAGTPPEPLEYTLRAAGRERAFEARFVRFGADEVLSLVRDITERRRAAHVLAWQAAALEQIATGRSCAAVMCALVQGIESSLDEGLGSVLLLEGQRLRCGEAPSLPAAYNAAIDGLEIGPEVGSCGAAAYKSETVVVSDIRSDPRWAGFHELAEQHRLRACWSVPILDSAGRVLGTFAVYHREPRSPAPAELVLVERAAALAGIAIEREHREGLLATIHRSVNEGLFRSAPARGLLYVNEAFVRMFGYDSAEQILRVPPQELYAVPAERAAALQRKAERGSVTSEEVLLRRRDGSTFWGFMNCTVVRDPAGAVVAFDGAVADISARKKLEENLRQAQKMEAVGRLAGGVAHDFNNLLTAIQGYGESLLDELPPAGRARQDAQQILRAAERAASLTRQLLAYSRQQVLAPQVLDLTLVVDQLGDLLRRLIGEHIRLTISHARREVYVLVDRGQIEQVVLNLVLNSRDALASGGALTIATEPVELDEAFVQAQGSLQAGSYLRLSVVDDGHGMNADTRARAFDPFFTTKEKGKGTGLGLSTVYGIVRQSEGLVALQSAPGAGTTVSVYLPHLPAPRRVEPVVTRAAELTPIGGTILVAEDEDTVREILSQTLRRAGYTVLEAADGAQALELAQKTSDALDLVITDLIMPRMGGRELTRRLRAVRPDMPVLVVSGYTAETTQPRAGLGDECTFIQKPFTRAELLKCVGGLLAR